MSTIIDWSKIVGSKTVEDGGYVGDLMSLADDHLAKVVDAGHVSQSEAGSVYSAMIGHAINSGMQFGTTKELLENQTNMAIEKVNSEVKEQIILDKRADLLDTQEEELGLNGIKDRLIKDAQKEKIQKEIAIATINESIADSTKADKIAMSGYKKLVEETNKDIAVGTKASKISMVSQQLLKSTADTSYVGAQQTALEEQVVDNRTIKAIDALGDTYGTFGAGGITVNAAMWKTYYDLVFDLTDVSTGTIDPNTITKVT